MTPDSKTRLWLQSFFIFLCWGTFCPQAIWAVRPLSSNIALVAGEGTAGFKEGSFTSALFHTPLGLAVSDDGTCIFVADSGNNRIRVIHLDQDNEVTTLTGQDRAGKQNGRLTEARFNVPSGVLCLPDNRLVVNDSGNHLFRLVNLKTGIVSTLAGGDQPLEGVRDMAYLSAADSIFFSQPDQLALKRLDLKTGLILSILNNNATLPHPAALVCQGDSLYVADRDLPLVCKIDWKAGAATTPVSAAVPMAKVLSLSWNGDSLYALLGSPDVPVERLLPASQQVSFRSSWGDSIPHPGNTLLPFDYMSYAPSVGFAPDPSDHRKFYVANSEHNMVVAFRDLFGDEFAGGDVRNSNGLNEPEYPSQKPKGTYRILFVGDSRSTMIVNYAFATDFHNQNRLNYPRNLSLSKQMERELNTLAALDEAPLNFEVLNLSHSATEPLFLWPTYEVPDIVKRNDVDLVVIFQPPTVSSVFPYKFYFTNPITADGIPKYPNDIEYLLKPPSERMKNGLTKHFYDLCKNDGLVKIEQNNFIFDEKLFQRPELHETLVQFYGKPLDVLNRKLSQMKTTSGQPVRLLLCSTYTGVLRTNSEDPQIWVDAAREYHIPFLDLNAEITALRLSVFPLAENGENHLNPDGHMFFGRLLAHDLIRDGFIPWKTLSKHP